MSADVNVAGDPYALKDEPTLGDLFRCHGRKVALSIRTHVPATVVAYNPVTNTASVTVQIQDVVRVKDLTKLPTNIAGPPEGVPPNAEVTLLPQLLQEIPCQIYRTAAGYFSIPIATGDTGTLHVHDRSLEAWKTSGIPAKSPLLGLIHKLKDSVFEPGFSPITNPIVPPIDLTATVVEGTLIKIGRLAALAAARATDPVGSSTSMIAWAGVVESAINTLAPGTFTPVNNFATVVPIGTITSGSTKTTVE